MKAKNNKLIITIVLILGVVGLIIFLKFAWFSSGGQPKDIAVLRSKGNPKAPIQIIEYVDLQCPACAKGAIILRDLIQRFPDKIYIQVKYFPLVSVHAHAIRSAVFSDCAAAQGKFWPFFDRIMDDQATWSKLAVVDDEFFKIAQSINLNEDALKSCIASEATAERVYKDKEAASPLGIQSTPTYFINGKMVVGTKILQEELNKLLGLDVPNASSQIAQ